MTSSQSGTLRRVGAGRGAVACALALMLVSCGTGDAPADDAPPANAAADTPPAAPSENRAARGAPARSVDPALTAEGYGPLRIGMTRAEIEAAMGEDSDPDSVGGPEPERCDQFRPARAPEGLLVMVEDGRLTRISLTRGARIETDRGLGLGAAAAAVRAAYGPALVAMPHEYQDPPAEYLTAWSLGRPAPDVADPAARGLRYEIGEDGKVETIHAGGPSIQYVEGCL